VTGKSVGLGVGSVEGNELGDGLGINDGLLLGILLGALVSGQATQVSVINADTADPSKPVLYTFHILASNGGVSTHSSLFSS